MTRGQWVRSHPDYINSKKRADAAEREFKELMQQMMDNGELPIKLAKKFGEMKWHQRQLAKTYRELCDYPTSGAAYKL